MSEPRFPIETNAQRISAEAEKLSGILTLYSFCAKRKIVEKIILKCRQHLLVKRKSGNPKLQAHPVDQQMKHFQ